MDVSLIADPRRYIEPMIQGMLEAGWRLVGLPAHGKLAMNRQRLILRSIAGETKLILHVYKVTTSGRGRAAERRIEITTTYNSGRLRPDARYRDVVIGCDPILRVYVGLDARRLWFGGDTHNASSFLDHAALECARDETIYLHPRLSELFGLEFHAIFTQYRVADYLLNASAIHRGSFGVGALELDRHRRMRRPRPRVAEERAIGQDLILEFPRPLEGISEGANAPTEEVDLEAVLGGRRSVSPEDLAASQRIAAENGLLGEALVYRQEVDRLMRNGLQDLARRVAWTSQTNSAAGFDIRSFELNGEERFIEVKSTQGEECSFPMSMGEWRTAERLRQKYLIVRVTNVRSASPATSWYRDPVALEAAGRLTRTAGSWMVDIFSR